jgi:hypothetical protein
MLVVGALSSGAQVFADMRSVGLQELLQPRRCCASRARWARERMSFLKRFVKALGMEFLRGILG